MRRLHRAWGPRRRMGANEPRRCQGVSSANDLTSRRTSDVIIDPSNNRVADLCGVRR